MLVLIVRRRTAPKMFIKWAAALAMLSFLAGCRETGTAITPRPAVALVSIAPVPDALLVGELRRLTAHLRSVDGDTLHDRQVLWASENEAIATVSTTGMVLARASGLAGIRATSEGRTGRAEIRIVTTSPIPVVTSVLPNSVYAGTTGPLVMRVFGEQFVPDSRIVADGVDRVTQYVSVSELRTSLATDELVEARARAIAVRTPAPGGGNSNATTFHIEAPPSAPPTITALAPSQITAGWNSTFTINVSGTGFTTASRIWWDGALRETEYAGTTLLRVRIGPADVRTARNVLLEVETPTPGGGRVQTVFAIRAVPVDRVDMLSPWGASWTWTNHFLPLAAVPRDMQGNEIVGRLATWSVRNSALAVAAPTGELSASIFGVARGQAMVEARIDGVAVERPISVYDAPPFDIVYGVGVGDNRYLAMWSPSSGNAPRRLPIGLTAFHPAPSPTGSLIAFTGMPAITGDDSSVDLYIVARDGTQLKRLTTDAAIEYEPAWSPDGRRVAYVSTAEGSNNVWVMNADGSGARRLTSTRIEGPDSDRGSAAAAPAWSPTGDRIAYTVRLSTTSTLWMMNADGTGKRQLTSSIDGSAYEPTWSTDGTLIVFRHEWGTPTQREIAFVSAADGTRAFPVFNTWPMSSAPSISPDGEWLVASDTPLGDVAALYAIPLKAFGGPRIVIPTVLGGARNARWIRRP